MAKIRSSIEIYVPFEILMAFLEDWRNAIEWYEDLYDWKLITENTMGNGARFS